MTARGTRITCLPLRQYTPTDGGTKIKEAAPVHSAGSEEVELFVGRGAGDNKLVKGRSWSVSEEGRAAGGVVRWVR